MKRKTLPVLVLILALLLVGCAQPPAPAATVPPTPVEINVFAASSLTESFGEIATVFEAAHPGVTILFNFGGSQQLAQQIIEGAPADVFASANTRQMDVVVAAGGVAEDAGQTFAGNRLVVIYPQDNPGGLTSLTDLAKPGLKLVLAAQEVPVGQYSMDFLDKAIAGAAYGSTYKEDVLKNVVSYEDNVRGVLAKVTLGEADAGIVYSSDVSGADGSKIGRLDIPDELNVLASYPIAMIKESKNPEMVRAFIDLVLSSEGQAILAKYHFVPVQ